MRKILSGLACMLFVSGTVLLAGGCGGESLEAIGVGIVCLLVSVVIANCVEKGCDDESEG